MEKRFVSSFPRKDENTLTHSRSSKYNSGQESRTGTPESSDFSTGEVLKLPAGERRTGLGRDGRRGILQCRPHTDLSEERCDGKKDRDVAYENKLKGLVRDLKGTEKCLILCAKSTGACPSVRSTAVSGTVLSSTEFWDFLCAHYNVSSLNI